jgi:hypothetical protein
MGTFLFLHHFPRGFQGSPETAAAAVAWFERLAPNLAGRTIVGAEAHGFGDQNAEPVPTAFEIITADDLEQAMSLAKAWPLVSRGGRIEVRELTTQKFTLPASAGARVSDGVPGSR